jgi:hypothetical protein
MTKVESRKNGYSTFVFNNIRVSIKYMSDSARSYYHGYARADDQ